MSDNVQMNISVPKKRGRKPKKSVLEELGSSQELSGSSPAPKKRGRKPKKVSEGEKEVKVPKKRGRKPMLSQATSTNKNLSENFMTKDNVLHLKINTQELNNNILLDTLYKYDPNINDPEPYDPKNMCSKSLNDSEPDQNQNNELVSNLAENTEKSIPQNPPHLSDLPSEEKPVILNNIETDYHNILNQENLNTNNLENIKISSSSHNKTMKNYAKKQTNTIMVYYNEYNKRKEWPKKSSINCFWCCHSFTCTPCALPTKIKNDVFHVFGNFCSKECAAAYNFDSGDNNNIIWERYSLLNHLYSTIEENPDLKIKLAPHRMTLEMFGGNLSIEEFRESFNTTKKYKVVFPPMVAIIPSVTENNKKETSRRNDAFYIPIDKERIKRVNNDLRLKRKNPVNNQNTLENCMRLKYAS